MEAGPRIPEALLAGAERPEVLGRLRGLVRPEAHQNAASRLVADAYVKVDVKPGVAQQRLSVRARVAAHIYARAHQVLRFAMVFSFSSAHLDCTHERKRNVSYSAALARRMSIITRASTSRR